MFWLWELDELTFCDWRPLLRHCRAPGLLLCSTFLTMSPPWPTWPCAIQPSCASPARSSIKALLTLRINTASFASWAQKDQMSRQLSWWPQPSDSLQKRVDERVDHEIVLLNSRRKSGWFVSSDVIFAFVIYVENQLNVHTFLLFIMISYYSTLLWMFVILQVFSVRSWQVAMLFIHVLLGISKHQNMLLWWYITRCREHWRTILCSFFPPHSIGSCFQTGAAWWIGGLFQPLPSSGWSKRRLHMWVYSQSIRWFAEFDRNKCTRCFNVSCWIIWVLMYIRLTYT